MEMEKEKNLIEQNSIFSWLDNNPLIIWIVLAIVIVLAVTIITAIIVSLKEGREISLWPPKIGPRPSDIIESKYETPGDPAMQVISNDERCTELTHAVFSSGAARLYTTRYSLRPVGKTELSRTFVATLYARIAQDTTETRRIISLNHESKYYHAVELLRDYGKKKNFALAVYDPPSKEQDYRLTDILVIGGEKVYIALGNQAGDWLRIIDKAIADSFAEYYIKNHWERDGIRILKHRNPLTETELEKCMTTLRELAEKNNLNIPDSQHGKAQSIRP